MPGETPDWGALSAQAFVYPVTDLGELAVRLGSIVSHDRRGDVVWMEDFEHSLNKWSLSPEGADSAVYLSIRTALSGRYSVRLVAGSDGTRLAGMIHYHGVPHVTNLGYEISFALGSDIDNFQLWALVYDGVNVSDYRVRWRDTDDDLQYLNSSGAWVTFATGLSLWVALQPFHNLKMVVNGQLGEYLRVILDTVEYDLSGVAATSTPSGFAPVQSLNLRNTGRPGSNDEVHIDNVILTQNEPL